MRTRADSTRQYLLDHPEVVARLRDRSLLAKDLAAQLGVHFNTVSKARSGLDLSVNTGAVATARRAASQARQARTAQRQALAQAVEAGRLNVDDAAQEGDCSRDTIYRLLRKRKAAT